MSVLRNRARVSPEFTYEYLLEVASIDMAASVLGATQKPREKRKREEAVAAEAERMYQQWTRTIWRRPKLSPQGTVGIPRPEAINEVIGCALLVDSAFIEPFSTAGISISADERRRALRAQAASYGLDPTWADRVLMVIESATKAQREIFDDGAKKQAARVAATAGLAAVTRGVLPLRRRSGDGTARDVASDLRGAAKRSGAVLGGLDTAEHTRELIRSMTHAVVVGAELCGDEGAISEVSITLAERRAESMEAIDTLRANGCPKHEIREAEETRRAVDLAIKWLATR